MLVIIILDISYYLMGSRNSAKHWLAIAVFNMIVNNISSI